MKILITGAYGFFGQNLCAVLEAIQSGCDRRLGHVIAADPGNLTVYKYDLDSTQEDLEVFCANCDFVFHLAGVNRPKDADEYMAGNFGFTSVLLNTLKKYHNSCPVMLSSSIQATLTGRYSGSEYGQSKKAGEELLFQYGKETGSKIFIYRFPNIFGKWCRPNYNSAIATFCYNTVNGLPLQVNDPTVKMDLVYIDDVVEEMLNCLSGRANRGDDGYCMVPVHHVTTLGWIADTIQSFPSLQEKLEVPDLSDPLTKKLYSTYLTYLSPDQFIYDLKMNQDQRGSFTELLRTSDRGQLSVNISKPGAVKGQHWHHTKNEKFIVVSGQGLIQLRRIGKQSDGCDYPVVQFWVSGKRIQVVEMIPGYTHNIINRSETDDLVTLIWTNEQFCPAQPDTFYQEV